ncbi:hypothetical protein ALSL_2553 [Aerosticca soli]|uniref:Uncharacterized protein n=1 Tax=Aerosticca soli TaxID=2010829 RepID=A0A2Z6E7Z9_9GAMM|nr:hypothetical protein ALSL_2553 [Aerosticca soli]
MGGICGHLGHGRDCSGASAAAAQPTKKPAGDETARAIRASRLDKGNGCDAIEAAAAGEMLGQSQV